MEAYHFDTLNRYKCFSEKLDVAKVLASKSWIAFDDTGERVLYLFQPDGNVIITTDGVGYKGTWQWIPVNNSLLIDNDDEITMLRPEYIDHVVAGFSLADTDRYVFFIEEKNSLSFVPKTLGHLNSYFLDKERKLIEQQIKTLDSAEAEKKMRLEEERIKECEEFWRKKDQDRHMRRAARIKAHEKEYSGIIACLLSFIMGGCLFYTGRSIDSWTGVCICVLSTIAPISLTIIVTYYDRKWYKESLEYHKIKHPNDPANQYLG